ncbi:MAG: PSP1 domain-containing protein [Brevinematia bacterium]
MYRVAYMKTFFDNLVFPYIVPEELEVEEGKMYLINTKFGEDIGLAKSGIKHISLEQFPLKKPQNHQNQEESEVNNNETFLKNANIELSELETIIKDEHSSDTLVIEEGIEKKIESFKVIRPATTEEVAEWKKLNSDREKAFKDTQRIIAEFNLPMKLISVYFLYQKKKVIFNFTAENRVDFRELVKKLASIYKTRIEMRQIGVRDASKILPNYGVCGLQSCCTRSNCHITSIYLKMAKDQGFAVNSSKLTGVCGRLMCCLAFEADFYFEERQKYPPLNSVVKEGTKSYRITSHNLITGDVYGEDENHHIKKFSVNNLKFLSESENSEKIYVHPVENNQHTGGGEINAV